MFDKFKEECGLIGIWNVKEAANLAYLGLYAQQHRGQEGAGIVALDRRPEPVFNSYRGIGLVADVFSKYDFAKLPGSSAIGHVRYTTAGQHRLANVQPFFAEISVGKVGLAHNGNLINADELREELIEDGAIFGTSSDTEAILHLLARTKKNLPRSERVISALQRIKGAYSLLMEFDDRMYAIRDPNGFRPLSLGKLNDGYVFASETCAFDLIGAEFVRDVEPGEVLEIDINNELKSYYPFGVQKESPCIFEYVYFSRPDSNIYGKNVYSLRINMGKELARESLVEADIVMAVPDSGVPAAIGYAQESGIPFEYGLIRNHYVGRTFIEPTQSIRDFGVKIKLNPNPSLLKGKRVVVVDDSIVRGTTSKKLVKMIQQAGAKEVHVRISSPPTTDPCYYGIDTPQKEKLIAANSDTETIRKYLGADTLSYISLDGLYRAVDSAKGSFCDACFTGNYPIGIGKSKRIEQVGLFESEE